MAKVIGGFKCPHTKKIYHVGDEYDGDYLEEMQKKGYIEETKDVLNPAESKAAKSKKSER